MNSKKTVVITDTGCDLPAEYFEKYNIKALPLRVTFSDAELKDRTDMTNEILYEKMTREYPKTSLPTRGDVYDLLDELAIEGVNEVLYVGISSGLSGTFNSMRLIAQEKPLYKGIKISVVDTKTLSVCEGYCVLEAAREIEKTNSIERAVRKVKEIRSKMTAYIALPSLEYLKKGGRIGNVEGTLGSLLHINPVITVDDNGSFQTKHKAIGFNRAVEAVVNNFIKLFDGKSVRLGVTHGHSPKEAEKLLQRLCRIANVTESFIAEVSPVLSVHSGPKILGVVVVEA